MADPAVALDAVNAVTNKIIWPRQITDNFYRAIPFFSMLRDKALMDFDGGVLQQYAFLFNAELGGAYAPGDTFVIDKVDTISAQVFREKYYQVSITEHKEEIQVRNRGAAAVFSLLDARLRNAMMTLNTIIAIASERHGQAIGGLVLDDRSNHVNGWAEALNDGVVFSWDGNIFVTYGGGLRNGFIEDALNSTPRWMGQLNGNPGAITYEVMEDMYQQASQGNVAPDLGVTSKRGMTLIKNAMQVQQRFAQEVDPRYGFEGVRLNKALITKDDYWPSAAPSAGGTGRNQPRLGNWLTGTITNTLTGTPPGGFPTSAQAATLTVGEVLAFFNTDTWVMRLSSDPEFSYGWTGFKAGQDSTRVTGQALAATNLECPAPRLNIHGFGFNS